MSSAVGSVLRGITSYVQQRVEGWRTGSRGSQAFLLLVLVALVGAAVGIGALAQVVVPVSLWFLVLMLGLMLLRFVPLLLLDRACWGPPPSGRRSRPASPPRAARSALVILAVGVLLAIYQSSRQRSGLPMALSEAVLTQLRDRLQRQGVVPPLPNGWRSRVGDDHRQRPELCR